MTTQSATNQTRKPRLYRELMLDLSEFEPGQEYTIARKMINGRKNGQLSSWQFDQLTKELSCKID